jgi:hypothetical protein
VPPAVALLNYISCYILWRIFAKLGQFAGFSLNTIILSEGSEKLRCAGNIIYFRVPRSLFVRDGEIGDGEIKE